MTIEQQLSELRRRIARLEIRFPELQRKKRSRSENKYQRRKTIIGK